MIVNLKMFELLEILLHIQDHLQTFQRLMNFNPKPFFSLQNNLMLRQDLKRLVIKKLLI